MFMRPLGAVEQRSSRGQADLRHNDSAKDSAVRSLASMIFFIEACKTLVKELMTSTPGEHALTLPVQFSVFRGLCPSVPPKLDAVFTVVDTVMCIIIENILDTLHQFCRALFLRVVSGIRVYWRNFAAL